jgi:hypothetical protein
MFLAIIAIICIMKRKLTVIIIFVKYTFVFVLKMKPDWIVCMFGHRFSTQHSLNLYYKTLQVLKYSKTSIKKAFVLLSNKIFNKFFLFSCSYIDTWIIYVNMNQFYYVKQGHRYLKLFHFLYLCVTLLFVMVFKLKSKIPLLLFCWKKFHNVSVLFSNLLFNLTITLTDRLYGKWHTCDE